MKTNFVCFLMLFFCFSFSFLYAENPQEKEVDLKIKVISAHNLLDKDWGIFFKKPDTYVEVLYSLDGKKDFKKIGETKKIGNEDNPVWNETFKIKASPKSFIGFRLYDKDLISKDDMVARVTTPAVASKEAKSLYFSGSKFAHLRIHITSSEPVVTKKYWILDVLGGESLKELEDKGEKDSKDQVHVGYRTNTKEEFQYVGEIAKIHNGKITANHKVSIEGPKTGVFSFLLADKKPDPKLFDKGTLLDAKTGEYEVRLPKTKHASLKIKVEYLDPSSLVPKK